MPADDQAPLAPVKTIVERLDALFAPWNRTDEPGLTVGVAQDGAVIYRGGFGMASLESAVANTPTTRMRIGSISKHFAALLALLLAEEGKLDLEAPIRAYIPELTGPAGDPTLRLLMQHRGGGRCAGDIGFLGHGMSRPPVGYGLKVQQRQRGRNFAARDGDDLQQQRLQPALHRHRAGGRGAVRNASGAAAVRPDRHAGHRPCPKRLRDHAGARHHAHADAQRRLAARPAGDRRSDRRRRDRLHGRRHAALDGAPKTPRPVRDGQELGGADRAAALCRRIARRLRARPHLERLWRAADPVSWRRGNRRHGDDADLPRRRPRHRAPRQRRPERRRRGPVVGGGRHRARRAIGAADRRPSRPRNSRKPWATGGRHRMG